MASLPAYQSSSLVQNAATASRLIVTTSEQISGVLTSGAESFTQRTKPASKPLLFTPAAHKRARKISQLTQGAAGLSAKTVGTVSKYAQNLGATVTRNKGRAYDRDGRPNEGHKPGFLNKSLIAFSTIMDGMEYSGRALLDSGSAAATTIVGHRFGENARALAAELGGSAKNVGLVYIDVTGVSRRAIIKSVAKGMVVGRVKGGGQVIVGGGDGGSFPPGSLEKANAGPSGTARHDQQTVGYGQTEDSAVPPPYAANGTEPPREKYS